MILDHLPAERVQLAGKARDKRAVLGELTGLLAGSIDSAEGRAILSGLLEREEVMSTGIGHGIAIPHARLDASAELQLALVRYPKGVDFAALDGKPVYLAFGVVGPPAGPGRHVKLLARIARLVKGAGAVEEILAATSVEAVLGVLSERDA